MNILKKKVNINHILIFTLLATLLNIIANGNLIIAGCICVFQVAILVFLFLKKDYFNYTMSLLIFNSFIFENAYYISPRFVVDFKSFEVLGFSLPNIFLVPIIIISLIHWRDIIEKLKNYKLLIPLFLLQIIALVVGIIGLLFNVNGIQSVDGYITEFIYYIYYNYFLVSGFMVSFIFVLQPSYIKSFMVTIKNILLGLITLMIITFIFNINGNYGGTSLVVPITTLYTPAVILFSVYERNYFKRFIYFGFGFLAIILNLMNAFMSKTLLVIALVLAVFIIMVFKRNRKIGMIALGIALIGAVSIYLLTIGKGGTLLTWKINQIFDLFSFWKPDWLTSLPFSPRYRIEELIAITQEFLHNPLYAVFGKGAFGTYNDYNGFLSGIPFDRVSGACHLWEWQRGLYFTTHESFTKFYLSFGLAGIFYYIYLSIKTFFRSNHNGLYVIGLIWFLFFYGYSIALSTFGIGCFVLAIMMDSYKYEDNQEGIAIIDLASQFNHQRLNQKCINLISEFQKVYVISKKDLYNSEKENCVVITCPMLFDGKHTIRARLFYLINILSVYYKSRKYYDSFDKIFLTNYDVITLPFFYIFFSDKKIYVYQHQQIDELENHVKQKFFSLVSNKIHHIILEDNFLDAMMLNGKIKDKKCIHVCNHPLLSKSKITSVNNKNNISLLSISNSNDEALIQAIINLEKETAFFQKNNISCLIRSKEFEYDDGYLKVELPNIYSKEELDNLYQSCDWVLILVKKEEFKNRLSGGIFDGLTNGRPIISIDIPIIKDLEKKYPMVIKSFSNIQEFQTLLSNVQHPDLTDGSLMLCDLDKMIKKYDEQAVMKQFKNAFGVEQSEN